MNQEFNVLTLPLSLKAAGLDVVADVLETQVCLKQNIIILNLLCFRANKRYFQAMMVANPHSEHKDIIDLIKRRIEGYIVATKHVMISYNVSNDLLREAVKITPGKKSPTITGLDDGNKSVSALVKKKEVNKKMDELHSLGATDILVFQVSNSRF